MASALSRGKMTFILDWLIADIAESTSTLLTSHKVLPILLHIDSAAVGTSNAKLDIDEWILILSHVLLDHFQCHLQGQLMSIILPAIWVLLVVLLSLSRRTARPTKLLIALGAADLSTGTAVNEGDPDATLDIGTPLGAMLQVDFIQSRLHDGIVLLDLHHLVGKFLHQIDPVNRTSLEWMHMLLAVKAKVQLTVLTPPRVFFNLNNGDGAT